MAEGIPPIVLEIKAKTDSMQKDLLDMEAKARQFEQKIRDDFTKTQSEFDKLKAKSRETKNEWEKNLKGMEDMASALTTKVGTTFAGIAASVGIMTKASGDFGQVMNNLQAVSGAAAAEMDTFKSKFMEMGAATKFSSKEVAEASVELAKLGFVPKEITQALDGLVSAASASGESLQNTAEIMAGTLRGFKLAASDANKVADMLAQSANISATSISSLGESMKYIGPIAAASSQKLSEMVGVVSVLGNSMIVGSQAGTSVRTMLASLLNPSEDATKIFKKLNFEAADSHGKLKPLPSIIAELQDKMKGLSEKTKGKLLAEMFGTEALSAASALMNTSKEDLKKMIEQIEKSEGASKKASDIMNQGLNYSMTQLKSSAINTAIAFGERMEPALIKVIDAIKSLVDWFGKLPDPMKDTIGQAILVGGGLTGIMTAAGVAGLGVIKFMGILGDLIKVFGGVETAAKAAAAAEALVGGTGVAGGAGAATSTAAGGLASKLPFLGAVGVAAAGGVFLNMTINAMADANDKESEQITKTAEDLGKLNEKRQGAYKKVIDVLNKKSQAQLTSQEVALAKQYMESLGKQNDTQYQTLSALAQGLKHQEITKPKKPKDDKTDPNQEAKFAEKDKEESTRQQNAAQKAISDMEARHKREVSLNNAELSKLPDIAPALNNAVNAQVDDMLKGIRSAADDIHKRKGKTINESVYSCYEAVWGGLQKLVDPKNFEKGNQNLARTAAMSLEVDKHWEEITGTWQQKMAAFKKTKGAVGVYHGPENDPNYPGHIEASLGNGQAISDYIGTPMGDQHQGRHYAGGPEVRVFVPKGSGGAQGPTKEELKALQEQKSLMADIVQLQAERAKLTDPKAIADLDTKLEELQSKLIDSNSKIVEAAKEAQKEQIAAYKKSAQEQLDLQSETEELKARLTIDKIDDIKAARDKALNDVKKEEIEKLQYVQLTADQRAAIEKNLSLKRQIIEKEFNDQVKSLNDQRQADLENMLLEGERAEIESRENSLDKSLALIDYDTRGKLAAIDKQMEEAKKLYGEDSDEYQLLELGKVTVVENAEKEKIKARIRAIDEKKKKEQEYLNWADERLAEEEKLYGEWADEVIADEDAVRASVEKLSPPMQAIIKGAVELGRSFGASDQDLLDFTKTAVAAAAGIDIAIQSIEKMSSKLGELKDNLVEAGSSLVSLASSIAQGFAQGGIVGGVFGFISGMVDGLVNQAERVKKNMEEMDRRYAQWLTNTDNIRKTGQEIEKVKLSIREALGEFNNDKPTLIKLKFELDDKDIKNDITQLQAEIETKLTTGAVKENGVRYRASKEDTRALFNPDIYEKFKDQMPLEIRNMFAQLEALRQKDVLNDANYKKQQSELNSAELKKRIADEQQADNQEYAQYLANNEKKLAEEKRLKDGRIASANEHAKAVISLNQNEFERKKAMLTEEKKQELEKLDTYDYNKITVGELIALGQKKRDVEAKYKQQLDEINTAHERSIALLGDENAILEAQLTSDKTDDILAEHQKLLTGLKQQEEDANKKMSGDELDKTLKNISLKRLTAEKNLQKQLKQLQIDQLTELDRLNNLQMEIEARSYEANIRTKQRALEQLQRSMDDLQRQKRDIEKDIEDKLKKFDKEDRSQFAALKAAKSITSELQEALKFVSNPTGVDAEKGTSWKAKREALEAYIKFHKEQLEVARDSEDITQEDYDKQASSLSVLRAKMAEEALRLAKEEQAKKIAMLQKEGKTEAEIDVTRKQFDIENLEFGKISSAAYKEFQELQRSEITETQRTAREALDEKIAGKQAEMDKTQLAIKTEQNALDDLKQKYQDNSLVIKERISDINLSMMDVGYTIDDVKNKFMELVNKVSNNSSLKLTASGALDFEQYKIAAAKAPGYADTRSLAEIPRIKEQTNDFSLNGGDGWFYQSSSDMIRAQGLKTFHRGGIQDDEGFALIKRKEMVLDPALSDAMQRFLDPTIGRSVANNNSYSRGGDTYAVNVTGNFGSNVDVEQAVISAVNYLQEQAKTQNGWLYN